MGSWSLTTILGADCGALGLRGLWILGPWVLKSMGPLRLGILVSWGLGSMRTWVFGVTGLFFMGPWVHRDGFTELGSQGFWFKRSRVYGALGSRRHETFLTKTWGHFLKVHCFPKLVNLPQNLCYFCQNFCISGKLLLKTVWTF